MTKVNTFALCLCFDLKRIKCNTTAHDSLIGFDTAICIWSANRYILRDNHLTLARKQFATSAQRRH